MYRWETIPALEAGTITEYGFGEALRSGFAEQGVAEAWLQDNYEHLALAGVTAVTLLCDEQVIYGAMDLNE